MKIIILNWRSLEYKNIAMEKKYYLIEEDTLEFLISSMHKLCLLENKNKDDYPEYEKDKKEYFFETLDDYNEDYNTNSAFEILGKIGKEFYPTIKIDNKIRGNI